MTPGEFRPETWARFPSTCNNALKMILDTKAAVMKELSCLAAREGPLAVAEPTPH